MDAQKGSIELRNIGPAERMKLLAQEEQLSRIAIEQSERELKNLELEERRVSDAR